MVLNTNRSFAEKVRLYFKLSVKRGKEGHLSLAYQLFEMAALFVLHGIHPGYYHQAGFWRRSIPWRDKTQHITGRGFGRLIKSLNPREYQKLSQHKLAEKAILKLLGFPTPNFLGYIDTGCGRTFDGRPLMNADDLTRLVDSRNVTRICFKQVEGWGGTGFDAVEVLHGEKGPGFRMLRGGSEITIEEYCTNRLALTGGGSAIIEEFLEQHPHYAEFNPSSVNTMRLWTLEKEKGKAEVIMGYLRIGREGSLVDNIISGGIAAPIDIESGVLSCALDGTVTREEFPVHPDHGTPIEGKQLINFDEAKSLAGRCLESFPNLRFAALDIAMSKDGPVVIEMNVNTDPSGSAITDIPHRKVFPV